MAPSFSVFRLVPRIARPTAPSRPHVEARALPARGKRGATSPHVARWLALALGAFGVNALAAPCADFIDVDDASGFCAGVDWIRNRAITLGCAAAQYCPDEAVTRLQMATFLRRLGHALRPAFLHADQWSPAFPGKGETVLCQTADTQAPVARTATTASANITMNAPGATTTFAWLVVSYDQGATWTNWSANLSATSSPEGAIAAQSPAAPPLALPPGRKARFGIQPFKAAGAPDIDEATCEMTVRLDDAG
jgi:hypothetical protein